MDFVRHVFSAEPACRPRASPIMSTKQPRLYIATGASCGPTAVGAATGNTRDETERAILAAAAEDDEYPTHLEDSSFRHQARAIELLGHNLFDLNGNPIHAKDIPGNVAISAEAFAQLSSIRDFVRDNNNDDILLCQAVAPSRVSHTFSVDRGHFYDNNTNGKIETSDSLPAGLEAFRVVRAVALRKT